MKIETVNALAIWMIEVIAKNRKVALVPGLGADWDWVAAEVWASYPGIVNEFIINDAIDFIVEAAEA